MFNRLFSDRAEAGRELARPLAKYRGQDVLVLGVPRGGVTVAVEVARALQAPLDVVMARKIGAPHQPELAIGAVVSGDHMRFLDDAAIQYLQVPDDYLERETQRQLEEINRRMTLLRGDRPLPEIAGRTVIVIDDGIATGYTIRAALAGLRRLHPGHLVVAVPVAPESSCRELEAVADEVVCLHTPEPFMAVGIWYEDFDQVTDEEVQELLREARPVGAGS
jgi:putative phosphoribosyl transferase